MSDMRQPSWNESLGDGIRRDHRTTCASSRDRRPRRRCGCPYSCWVPDPSKRGGQRRVQISGDLAPAEAKREKQRLVVAARHAAATAPAHPVGERAPATLSMPTVLEWVKRCMASPWRDLAPTTRATREQTYRRMIHPHLGAHRLDQITPLVIADWYDALHAAHGVTRTTELAAETLRAMLNVAVELELLDRCPIKAIPRVPRSSATRRGQRCLTHAQYQQLKGACTTDQDLALVRVATECCLRRGELCALRWQDIDTERMRLVVARSVSKDARGRPLVGERKSGGVARPSMPQDLAQLLTRLRENAFARGVAADDPVWPGRGRLGAPWDPTAVAAPDALGRRLKRLIIRAGLVDETGAPLATTHDLRRTGASLAATAGVPEVIVQHQLGHATPDTTRQFYVRRPDEAMQDRFADTFAQAP